MIISLIPDLAGSFIKEVQSFVKSLFLSGQNDLQTRDFDSEREENEHGTLGANKPKVINRFKLNVQTNAVCVDILVWATKDEYGKVLAQALNHCRAELEIHG